MSSNRSSLILGWLFGAIACLGLWFPLTIPVLANQEIYQSALLISSEPGTPLAIYPDPSREQSPLGYGEEGDKILVLEKIYSNDGNPWDRIRLLTSPPLEGWIADVYVKREKSDDPPENPYKNSNQYYSQDNYSQGHFVQQQINYKND
jgi:hypothetical protein